MPPQRRRVMKELTKLSMNRIGKILKGLWYLYWSTIQRASSSLPHGYDPLSNIVPLSLNTWESEMEDPSVHWLDVSFEASLSYAVRFFSPFRTRRLRDCGTTTHPSQPLIAKRILKGGVWWLKRFCCLFLLCCVKRKRERGSKEEKKDYCVHVSDGYFSNPAGVCVRHPAKQKRSLDI